MPMREESDEIGDYRGAVLIRTQSVRTRNGDEVEWQARFDESGPAIWVRIWDRMPWKRSRITLPWEVHRKIEAYATADDAIRDLVGDES